MKSTCMAQTGNCGEAEAVAVEPRGEAFFFMCAIIGEFANGQPWVSPDSHIMYPQEANEVKNAGPCSTESVRPCQGATAFPINIAVGNKFLVETDYSGAGMHGPRLTRYYNSGAGIGVHPVSPLAVGGVAMGSAWRHSYERSIYYHAALTPARATVGRPEGTAHTFTLAAGVWVPEPDVVARLSRLTDAAGNPTGWKYFNANDEVEMFGIDGRLLSITNRAGLTQTLTYNNQGRLATVTDSFGRTLTFTYHPSRLLASTTDPAGTSHVYAYDGARNLSTVTYPDGKVRTYNYVPPTSNINSLLVGVTDENNSRFISYTYDSQGIAVLAERAGGVERVTLQYNAGSTVVSDAFGTARTYTHATVLGSAKNTGVDKPCSTCEASAYGYDANGFFAHKIDFNANRTNYTYNTRGLETTRIEGLTSGGATTSATRTTTTEWHADYRLPTRIAEPNRRTTFTYGAANDPNPGNRGSVLTKTVQSTSDSNGSLGFGATLTATARTWTYTYNGNGQVLTVNGPRIDVSDITTYSYYANNATCAGTSITGCRGQVNTITNALGHITTINEYNAHAQPARITDPNGLVTTLAYDARMRLTRRDVGGEVTRYAYDPAGQLVKVTLPDGSFLEYTYDAAHRMTRIADNAGNSIAYTLDLMSNRTREDVRDPGGALAQTRTRVYSSLNRLSQELGAAGQATTYSYDNQGNVTSIDGPLAGTVDVTINAYDALNRLVRVTDPRNGQVNYGYSGLDQFTSVTDPRALKTTYSYDGLGNLNQQISPDTGATTHTYDAAGNLMRTIDARGHESRYTYDALNRVMRVELWGGAPLALQATHTYTYDTGTNQKGRLTHIAEPNSTTAYTYDLQGRLRSEARTINAVTYTTGYGYDAAGRMDSITYPSGRQLTYTLDNLGRVQSITSTRAGLVQPLVTGIAYRAFGPVKGFMFGNNQTYTRGFDGDGRISSYTLANQTFSVGYDTASRIQSIAQSSAPTNTNTYGYDTLDRLTSFAGPSITQGFSYDAVGNRLTETLGAASATYSYPATSNRLSTVSGLNMNRTYSYDAMGSVLGDGANIFTYDARGRMVRAGSGAAATDYRVNALGQRIRKTNSLGDTVYHYDSQGRLIAESSAAGAIRKEYVYLGDIPVAVLQ
jgi:YD repeat-containing protein